MPDKAEFNSVLWKTAMQMVLGQSDQQMEPYIRQKIKDCLASDPTPRQLYDLMAEIAKLPCVKISDNVCVGDISSFIQKLCDVTPYYIRPEV